MEIRKAFKDYCTPKARIVYERFKFNSRRQGTGEYFHNFLTDIKKLIKSCQYCAASESSILRDRIVLGINDRKLQEKLLKDECPLEKTIEICQVHEASAVEVEHMQQRNHQSINKISDKSSFYNKINNVKPKQGFYYDRSLSQNSEKKFKIV